VKAHENQQPRRSAVFCHIEVIELTEAISQWIIKLAVE
jgi:hypothetical protein